MNPIRMRSLPCVVLALLMATGAQCQTVTGPVLTKALIKGGYVIVMRHASSPSTPPAEPDAGNPGHERQLDAAGRASATAMGKAIQRLHIRIGELWSSPTYRARQTISLAGLAMPQIAPELGDQGHSMQAVSTDQGAWLKARTTELPRQGTDTLVVTQYPNITAAFGQDAAGLSDGEALVFQPAANGRQTTLFGRIRIEDWPALADFVAGASH